MEGLDELLSRLQGKQLTIPDNLTDDQLLYWMLGYTACQDAVVEVIRQLKEGDRENRNKQRGYQT